MNELLARLCGVFVAPAAAAPRAATRAHSQVGLVGAGADADVAACALALALAARGGQGPGVVCAWGGGPAAGVRLPGTAAARRLATRLAARELSARATGRLVRVALPEDPDSAAAEAARAVAASPGPAVIAVCAPRTAAVDDLLALQDGVVVVAPRDGEAALPALACEGLARVGIPAAGCAVPAAPVARLLATAGLAATASLRAALAPGLRLER